MRSDSCLCAETRAHPHAESARAGTRCREQAGGEVRQQRSAVKRQGSTDTVAASLAAGPTISLAFDSHSAFADKKNGVDGE